MLGDPIDNKCRGERKIMGRLLFMLSEKILTARGKRAPALADARHREKEREKMRSVIWRSRSESRRRKGCKKEESTRASNRGDDRPWKLSKLKCLKRWNIRPGNDGERSEIELSNPSGVTANGWKREIEKKGRQRGNGGGGERESWKKRRKKREKAEKTDGNPRVTRTRPISEWINSRQKSRRR